MEEPLRKIRRFCIYTEKYIYANKFYTRSELKIKQTQQYKLD